MTKAVKDLRQKIGELVTQARSLHEKAEKEERAFTDEESGQWDNVNSEIEKLKKRLEVSERAQKLGEFAEGSQGVKTFSGSEQRSEQQEDGDIEKRAFNAYLQKGMANLDAEELEIAKRAFTAGTNNTGGYTVPADFYNQLEVALKAFGGMIAEGDFIDTETGATLPMPSFNYTNVLATIVGEGGGSVTDSSTPFGVVNLGSYTYRSPILPVSYEFLQDTAFGEKFITDSLAGSIAHAFNAHATTGTGTGQPKGVVTAAVAGKTGTTGQTTSIIFDDVVDLVHSIDPAYRAQSKFMMHDQSLKVVRKLKDSSGRPIFMPGFDGLGKAMADTILGYEVAINQDVAQMAANAKSVLFGAFKKYKVRMVRNVQVLRLTERYADQLQVAFLLFARMDGNLLDAGTNPIKYYANSAT